MDILDTKLIMYVVIGISVVLTLRVGCWLAERKGWSDTKGKLVATGIFSVVFVVGLVLLVVVMDQLSA